MQCRLGLGARDFGFGLRVKLWIIRDEGIMARHDVYM